MTLAPPPRARADELTSRFSGLHILVVGDVMVDRFVVGKVTRISPEAPVPVVRFEHESVRLGGAANVANNLVALGARVSLVGVVGTDEAARRLGAALAAARIASLGLVEDGGRPTVEKVRIVTDRHQQVARIDYEEDADVLREIELKIVDRIENLGAGAHALIVSDYLKGTITPAVVHAMLALKSPRVPLIVDPKIPHLKCYAGATVVTPNQQEAEAATHRRIRRDEDVRAAAIEFRHRANCDSVLMTRGEQGMWLSSPEGEGPIPAITREVADATGAGDTVVAAFALALAAGATLSEAAVLANHAASIVVGKFGAATVTPGELLASIP